MKNFIFVLLAMLAFSVSGNAQTRTSAPNEQKIHLEFGRKSLNCAGFGICIFRIELEVSDVIAIVQAFFNNGRLQVNLPAAFYDANKSKMVNNVITIEEDFLIPATETSKMGRSTGYTIKRGKYPLVLNPDTNTYSCTF